MYKAILLAAFSLARAVLSKSLTFYDFYIIMSIEDLDYSCLLKLCTAIFLLLKSVSEKVLSVYLVIGINAGL